MTELAQDSRGNSFGAGVARLERASKPKSKAKEALDIKELALKGIALTNADDNLNLGPSKAIISNPNFNIDYYKYICCCDGSGSSPRSGIVNGGYGFRINNEEPQSGAVPGATNNVAEYTSLIELLKELGNKVEPGDPILILMDSILVVNQVNDSWGTKFKHLADLKSEAQALLLDLNAHLIWVPRIIMVKSGVDGAAYDIR